jgi:hypothetical protein
MPRVSILDVQGPLRHDSITIALVPKNRFTIQEVVTEERQVVDENLPMGSMQRRILLA